MPPDAEGRPSPEPATTCTIITAAQSTASAGPPEAVGTAFPPAGRRHRWLTLVARCGFCSGGGHVHYGSARGPARGTRRAGCGIGSYVLVAVAEQATATASVAS
jgi:hypothetical protein